MGFICTLVLSRLLKRDDFGLMAMALSVMGLVETFVDLGFLSAIIQAKDIQRTQLSSCFWLLMAMSVFVSLAGLTAAPLIALAFAEERMSSLMYWLAPLFLLAPLTITSKGVLSRELRLDVVARIDLFSGFLKMMLSIILAFLGFGVFSLVYGYVIERILLAFCYSFAACWFPRIEYAKESVKPFLRFGIKATSSSLLWYLYTRADIFVIGRVLGAEILGIYTIAAQFPQTVARLVPSTWQRIAYPLFARHQHSTDLKQIVVRASSLLILVCLPLFAGMVAIAPDLIEALFGARWQGAVFPLRMLAIVAAIETITGTLPVVLNAIGRPGVNTLVNLMAVAIFPASYYFSANCWGIEGVLIASIVAYLYRFFSYFYLVFHFLKLDSLLYAKEHFGAFVSAAAMIACVVVANWFAADWNIHLRMASCIIVGAISYISVSFITSRKLINYLISYVRTTS